MVWAVEDVLVAYLVSDSCVVQRSGRHLVQMMRQKELVGERSKRLLALELLRLPENQLVQGLRPLPENWPLRQTKQLLEKRSVPEGERSPVTASPERLERHSFEVSPAPLAHSQRAVVHLLATVGWELGE